MDADLTTTTDANGEFEFKDIPLGKYVILYNPSGMPQQSIDHIKVEVNDKSAACLGGGFFGSMPDDCTGSVPFIDDPNLTLVKDSSISISATGGFTLSDGAIYSVKYGLYLGFEKEQPLSVEIQPGKTVEIVIKVWGE